MRSGPRVPSHGQHTAPRCLILNAAEARSDLVLTDEGIETNFATNHLAGFLLTHPLAAASVLGSRASGRDLIVGALTSENG